MSGPGTRLSVRARLALFTAMMVGFLVALGGIAVVSAEAASQRVHVLGTNVGPARQANAELQSRMLIAERSFTDYLALRSAFEGTGPEAASEDEVLEPLRAALQRLPSDLQRLDHATRTRPFDDPQVAGNIADLLTSQRSSMTAWSEWARAQAETLTGDPDAPAPTETEARYVDQLFAAAMRDTAAVQASLDGINASLRQEVLDILDRTLAVLAVATLIAVAVALFVAWRTTRGLVVPIARLGDTVRRQRVGERQAWADTSIGAPEVRHLAADVNALNREHLRLVDKQAQSLALLRAANDIVAVLGRVDGPDEAVDVAAETVGRTLGVDAVRIAGWSDAGQPFAAVWSRSPSMEVPVPEMWWQAHWSGGERLLPADDLIKVGTGAEADGQGPLPAWVSEDPVVVRSNSALFLPISVNERVTGLLSVHTWAAERTWDEPEIAYLQRVTRELARLATAMRDS